MNLREGAIVLIPQSKTALWAYYRMLCEICQGKKVVENMLGAQEQRSEVRRILEEIEANHRAAELALYGPAFGTSKHEFIALKMNRMHKLHGDLQEIVGDAAIGMIAHQIYPTLRKKEEKQ